MFIFILATATKLGTGLIYYVALNYSCSCTSCSLYCVATLVSLMYSYSYPHTCVLSQVCCALNE